MSDEYFLKSNVQIEPLINFWHAYPFLVAPIPAAMVTKNYQLNVMKSYLQMPMAHVAALKDPDMVGGPFIDLGGELLGEVRELKNQIEMKWKEQIKIGGEVEQTFNLLLSKAKGSPMEGLYELIPSGLRGFIELVYDSLNRPSFRLIEALLYKSKLYDQSAQTVALSFIHSDARSFIFSTPRIVSEDTFHIPFTFSDKKLDYLADLRSKGSSLDEIQTSISFDKNQMQQLLPFLTTKQPALSQQYAEDGVRIRFFGHACVLLESNNVTLLTDPLISYKYETDISRFTFEDLPPVIDYVVITHCHHDHIVLETLLQIRSKIKKIIVPRGGGSILDPSMKQILENIGFSDVVEVDDLQSIGDDRMTITGIPFFGEHCDLDIRSKAVYHVKVKQRTFLFAADSSAINPDVYRNVHDIVGDVEALFVGLECTGAPMSWTYGSLFHQTVDKKIDNSRKSKGSDSQTAMLLAKTFRCNNVYLYAMGAEPWLNYFMALQHDHSSASQLECETLLRQASEEGMKAEKLFAKKEVVFH